MDVVTERRTTDKFSRVVDREEIRKNDYNLNIPRYVDTSEPAESWDILATMSGGIPNAEIDELNAYWSAFPNLRSEIFHASETPYSTLTVEDVKKAIADSNDIKSFSESFNEQFANFEDYLHEKLINGLHSLENSTNEEEISSNIFGRLATIPLIDKYEAYQLLDGAWSTIASDIETIQRDGFSATKCVDPHMVLKKKGNIEEEIQEGWVGRIIPFDLAQKYLLSSELAELKTHEDRLAEISSMYEEALDSLSEEDKEAAFVNEDKTAFVWAEVKKAIKAKDVEDETLSTLKAVSALNNEEKSLKKSIKEETQKLHQKTKNVIEALSDEQAEELLKMKWIEPLISALYKLPKAIVDTLSKKVNDLAKKYSTTLNDLETEIEQTEKDFCTMLDDLTGDEFDMKGLAELKKLLRG